jgi:hypothetical protein
MSTSETLHNCNKTKFNVDQPRRGCIRERRGNGFSVGGINKYNTLIVTKLLPCQGSSLKVLEISHFFQISKNSGYQSEKTFLTASR